MTYVAEKLEEFRVETERLKALAVAITDKPELTPQDRKQFEEYLSLMFEIQDYAARLTRTGEKWKHNAIQQFKNPSRKTSAPR